MADGAGNVDARMPRRPQQPARIEPCRRRGADCGGRISFRQQPRHARHRCRLDKIGLADHKAVGHHHLALGLRHAVQIGLNRGSVGNGYHRFQMEFAADAAVGDEGLQDRRRIGKAAGFNDNAVKTGNGAGRRLGQQLGERFGEIAAHAAAQTAIAQQHDVFAGAAKNGIVDADIAEFVDDDCAGGALRTVEKTLNQRRLAGAQKAGD